MTSLNQLSAGALRQGYLRRELSPVEVLEAVATRVEQTRRFNAFITPLPDAALAKAQRAEKLYLSGETDSQPLLGVPIAVKDNYDMEQVRTTYGSLIFADHLPRETAECVRRVEVAGAIVVGKTSLHEFAWGITGENPHFGPCHNPWDFARIAGGSSSGSAAALALMVAPLALGSDTAGSIRIPASLCGIVGMKPSYDRLPRSGLFPLAPTLDHVGLMSREPRDLAALLKVVDDTPLALTITGLDTGPRLGSGGAMRGLRVGVLPASSYDQLDGDISSVVRAALDVLISLGAELVELDAQVFAHALGTFAPIQQAEAFFVLIREASSRHADPSTEMTCASVLNCHSPSCLPTTSPLRPRVTDWRQTCERSLGRSMSCSRRLAQLARRLSQTYPTAIARPPSGS